MKITLKPQTCITMIGASHSGKSYQSKQIKSFLESIGKTCKIIESDEIRKNLLHLNDDDDIGKSAGFVISEITFKKLRSDLEYYMSSPCNTDVVIVDTTGLDKTFRQEICQIAKDQAYSNVAMIFQLNRSTIYKRITEDEWFGYKKSYIDRQLKRLKEKVLPDFNRHDYMDVYRITDKHESLSFEYSDKSNILEFSSGKFAIYGDVHQQIEELKMSMAKAEEKGFNQHILIGDYIDKDDELSLLKTIDFVYDQWKSNKILLIKANHEDYVYRHLTDPNYVFEHNEETEYFTSLEFLVKPENESHKNKLIEMYENSYDFIKFENHNNYTYISHSPCDDVYLGKLSPKSLKMMRNTRFFSEENKTAVEMMKPILDQSSSNKALHIFGHVEVGKNFHTYKNKIAIDGGCVSGGHLITCLYDLDSSKKEFIYQETLSKEKKNILDFNVHIKQWSNRVELDPFQEKQLRRIVKANPAFISGTVSPSPSSGKDMTLESVNTAIELYKSRGITDVYAQKKHMGSRCQVYLFKERENCYAISRNGYRIKHPDIDRLIDIEYEKYSGKYETLLITDNELMPWKFLGEGLVNYQFLPYYQAVNADIKLLEKSGLKDHIGYNEETYENIEKFNKQVEIYGKDTQGYLETFGIIYKDGVHYLESNQEDILSEFNIHYEKFDLTSENDCKKLNEFYEEMIKDGITEGICLKPLKWSKDDIPCLKIRNTEYLRIVYGFDYTSYLQRHIESKNIKSKLNLSIKEHNLNLRLLEAYINDDKSIQKEIYASLITEFSKEQDLDPRL